MSESEPDGCGRGPLKLRLSSILSLPQGLISGAGFGNPLDSTAGAVWT